MYIMEECINKWAEYIECVDRHPENSKICKPVLQEYNECVFRNEKMHLIKKPVIIEKNIGLRGESSYWNNENTFVWWSL